MHPAIVKAVEMREYCLLHGLGHKVFTAYQTENSHVIIFVKDSQHP